MKLKSIFINTANKDGTPYINKNGEPFKIAKIQLEDGEYASCYLGARDNLKEAMIRSWKPGDDVNIKVEKDENGYLNFSLPSKTDLLEERVSYLEGYIEMQLKPFLKSKFPQG